MEGVHIEVHKDSRLTNPENPEALTPNPSYEEKKLYHLDSCMRFWSHDS